MPGLSPDPDKARRQLGGLATANQLIDVDRILAAREEEPAPVEPSPVAPTPPAPALASPAAAPPATVAGLPVRPASNAQEPVDDPAPPPEPDPEPEPAAGPDADPEPDPGPDADAGGWRGFVEGLAFG